ncbi:MAG: SMP-30/gluconolactonase/LRE family protein [Sphaerochaetaceae bacterium]|nr:SMP-30/gluconolactonase/LRE family protein [Sphaerochaetaceae bacterium]
MTDMHARPISDITSSLGESPVWDPRTNRLYWIDYTEKKINWHDPETGDTSTFQLDVTPGCVAPTEYGKLLVGYRHEIGLFDMESEQLTTLFAPEAGKDYNHFNDGKCDAAGRFWLGSITETQDWPGAAFYRIEGRTNCKMMFDNVTTSNGLAWSPDNGTFYYIDTMTYSVAAFDFNLDTGELKNKRTIIDFRPETGRPDGMTIDAEGFLWIAHWNGGQISRWNPNTGICLARLPVPAYNVTSCYFGGPALDRLYITSASVETGETEFKQYPLSGRTFVIEPGVSGLPTNFVKGM